ncbi:MAG: hypothetical protein R2713_01725 [Ilumatobacteraceae bacterium]
MYGTATTVEGGTVELRLDLYLPRGDTATSRPVFVHAHGGFFWIGGKEGPCGRRGWRSAGTWLRRSTTGWGRRR